MSDAARMRKRAAAALVHDLTAGWVLRLLDKYPTAQRIAQAHRASLEKIPHFPHEQAPALHQAAQQSVASLHGSDGGHGWGPWGRFT